MKIYVIRHGQTELNKKEILNGRIDEPLALEGREQAMKAALHMPKTLTHTICVAFTEGKRDSGDFKQKF